MDYTDLQSKGIPELNSLMSELKLKLGKLRFQLKNKTLKNTSELGIVRRDIARINTALKKMSLQS